MAKQHKQQFILIEALKALSVRDVLFFIGITCLVVGVALQFGAAAAWMTAGGVLLSVSILAEIASWRRDVP